MSQNSANPINADDVAVTNLAGQSASALSTDDKRSQVANFSAGPAALPTEVLARAAAEMSDWQGMGVSVMEISHRSKAYIEMAERAEASLRRLMHIPADYKVLFLQGGATLQFSAIPLNLLAGGTADYLTTGTWSKKAIKEAQRYASLGLGQIHEVASSANAEHRTVPTPDTWHCTEGARYFHYCANETIHGVQIFDAPKVNAPLVVDMSSCILSAPINVADYGLIYAGAQKNIGPAGLTIVIVHESLLDNASDWCPMVLNYRNQADKDSMLNTPATYSWYLAGLVFDWLEAQGGIEAMASINAQKARLLYEVIDGSDFYHNGVDTAYRSIMNIPFTLADASLDGLFLQEATEAGLLHLKGHRDVGGMRASIYNAVPLSAVQTLAAFMRDFAQRHG